MMAVAKYDTIKAIWDIVNMMGNGGEFRKRLFCNSKSE